MKWHEKGLEMKLNKTEVEQNGIGCNEIEIKVSLKVKL
jgi:hypothetical protein